MKNFNQDKFLLPNIWHNYFIPSENQLLSNNLIKEMLHKFWNDIINNIDDKMVILLFRIQFEDKTFRTIGNLQKINHTNFTILYKLLTNLLSILSDDYKNLAVINIIFSYKIIDTDNKKSKIDTNNIKSNKIPTFKFYGYNLPLTIDFKLWGRQILHENNHYLIKRINSDLLYDITVEPLGNIVNIIDSNNINILKFKDIPDLNNINSFTRIINNQKYYIKNGQLILKTLNKSSNLLTILKKDKKLINNFITLDIETQTINNVMTPYALSFYDGKKLYSFYLTDYKDSNELLTFAISSLLKRKYNGYKIYVHNLSNFDGIFLLKILSVIDNIKIFPIIKDNKMINIKLSYEGINNYTISFRDSLLMLPSSLSKLTKQFNVDNKGIFQYNEYKKLYNKSWSLKEETIKYCNQDCISLYQIIYKFNESIFNQFSMNIH